MNLGFIQSNRKIFWSNKKREIFFITNESKGDVIITGGPVGAIEAYICKKCRKVIINY